MSEPFLFPSQIDDQPRAEPAPAATEAGMGTGFDFAPAMGERQKPEFKFPSQMDEANGPTLGTTATAPFVGFNRGVANTIGAPVDIVNWGMGKLGLPVSEKPFGGSESIKSGMGYLGANPDEHAPRSTTEKYLQAAGEGAGSMVGGELAAAPIVGRLAATAPKTAEAIGTIFGKGNSAAASATNAAVGATGSMAGEAAAEITPEKYKPLARMAGTIAGGAPVAAGAVGVRAAKDAIAPKVGEFLEPFTKAGQEAAAARQFKGLFSDAPAAADSLNQAAEFRDTVAPGRAMGEMVPGSKPTTPQLTGDKGALSLEREMATANPEKFNENTAGTGAEQQNKARVDALGGIEPAGRPEDVSGFLNKRLAEIDAEHNAAVNVATQGAQGRASEIGSGRPPEVVGNDLRTRLQDAEQATRANERALWKAVDPEGKLALPASPVAKAAGEIAERQSALAKPMDGEERAIFQAASNLPPVIPFNDMTALRSRVSTEMRNELRANGSSPTYARLSELRGRIESAISNAVDHQAANDHAAVASGAMSEEATMAARVQQWANEHFATKAALASDRVGAQPGAGGGASSVAGPSGTAGESGRGFRGDAGTPGVAQAPSLAPNFDAGASERLNAASGATKDRAQTFGQGPVGQVLKTQGSRDNFRMGDASVPGALVRKGPGGFDASEAYRRAVNGDPLAMDAFHDAAAESLRRDAMTKDGMIDPAKFERWQAQHSDMLRGLPEKLQAKFKDAAAATQAVTDAAAARKQALDTYQAGILGKVMGVSDPADVTKTIGGILGAKDGVMQMRRLATEAAKDPDAAAGLRRAVMDSIIAKSKSATNVGSSGIEGIKPDTFKKLVFQNENVLKAAGFSPQEIGTLHAIAADIARSQQTLGATKLPGQSNTAADLLAHMKRQGEAKESLWGKLWKASVVGGEGGGPKGSIAAMGGVLGQHTVSMFRDAGMKTIMNLVEEGIRNPEVGRLLLQPVPKVPNAGSAITLRNVFGRLSQFAAEKSARPTPDEPDERPLSVPVPMRADGGRVQPSEAQKEAGNYKKDHVSFQGLQIAIENAKGATRSGTDHKGKPWKVRMPADYGYIKRTEGADGDHVDCYLGPNRESDKVFIVDQSDERTQKFDEHKVMLGFASRAQALHVYREGFSDGKGGRRLGGVTEMPIGAFKDWLKSADLSKPSAAVHRAAGGRVGDPAKRASHLEKQANRIRKAYGGELEPLMRVPDHVVAQALRTT